MARQTRLRQEVPGRPASAGRFVVPHVLFPVLIAAILAVTAVTVLAVHELAGSSNTNRTTAPAFLTKQLGAPQARSSLVRKPAPDVNLGLASIPSGEIAFSKPNGTGDLPVRSAAILVLAGVNFTPIGLGWKLKQAGPSRAGELPVNAPTFRAPFVTDPTIVASSVTTSVAVDEKVLDLSRPTRAGPVATSAINEPIAASSHADSQVRGD